MQANRCQHHLRKNSAQKRYGQKLMQIINTNTNTNFNFSGLTNDFRQQMTQIVQQGRGNKLWRATSLLGKIRALKRMLLLAYCLRAVLHGAPGIKKLCDFINLQSHENLLNQRFPNTCRNQVNTRHANHNDDHQGTRFSVLKSPNNFPQNNAHPASPNHANNRR